MTTTWSFVQKRLNEDVIDYDLLEDLVCHVDETCSEGAILVFLPVSPFRNPFKLLTHPCNCIASIRNLFFDVKLLHKQGVSEIYILLDRLWLLIDLVDHLQIGFFLYIHP